MTFSRILSTEVSHNKNYMEKLGLIHPTKNSNVATDAQMAKIG